MRKHGIEVPEESLAEFCRRRRVRKLAFFGSFVRDDFRPESDIDVLVEFEPNAGVGFLALFDMEQELSELLGGRRVEINTPNSLSPYFRDEVLAEAEVQYVAA
jgi:predicted nucleotidyltransferase